MRHKKTCYCFAHRMIRTGGTENLIVKLATQIVNSTDFEVRCVCEFCSTGIKELLNRNHVCLDEIDWREYREYCERISDQTKVVFITFEWDTFLKFFFLEIDNKKTILYSVHPECIKGNYIEGRRDIYQKDLKVYSFEELSVFINDLIKSNHVLIMDEIVKNDTELFFNTKLDFRILRICVDLPYEWEDCRLRVGDRYSNKTILTAARADFPFKGYLLGMISWIQQINIPDLKLTMVCYGEGYNIVKEMVDGLPEQIKKRVVLYGQVTYDELKGLINDSFIFVGMGTSVIDAAALGIPTIPIEPYEYDVKCNFRFDENPYNVCAANIYPYADFTQKVREMLDVSLTDYEQIAKTTFECVQRIYGTPTITTEMIDYAETCTDDLQTGFLQVEKSNKATEVFLNNIVALINKERKGRKVVIYGNGIGGRELLCTLKSCGVNIDSFADKKNNVCDHVYDTPVVSPQVLNQDKHYVIVSLKTRNNEIENYLQEKGFLPYRDYIYPHCEYTGKERELYGCYN